MFGFKKKSAKVRVEEDKPREPTVLDVIEGGLCPACGNDPRDLRASSRGYQVNVHYDDLTNMLQVFCPLCRFSWYRGLRYPELARRFVTKSREV